MNKNRLIAFATVAAGSGTAFYMGSKNDYFPPLFESKGHKIKVPHIHYDRYLKGTWEEEMLKRLQTVLPEDKTSKLDEKSVE